MLNHSLLSESRASMDSASGNGHTFSLAWALTGWRSTENRSLTFDTARECLSADLCTDNSISIRFGGRCVTWAMRSHLAFRILSSKNKDLGWIVVAPHHAFVLEELLASSAEVLGYSLAIWHLLHSGLRHSVSVLLDPSNDVDLSFSAELEPKLCVLHLGFLQFFLRHLLPSGWAFARCSRSGGASSKMTAFSERNYINSKHLSSRSDCSSSDASWLAPKGNEAAARRLCAW